MPFKCFFVSCFFSFKDLLPLNGELLPEPDVLFIEVADLLHGEDRKQAGEQDQDDAAVQRKYLQNIPFLIGRFRHFHF